MSAIPSNPQISPGFGNDSSITESLCTFSDSPVVTSNSHPIQSRADGALWDTTSSAYVSIQNTSVGTTACPKNGQ